MRLGTVYVVIKDKSTDLVAGLKKARSSVDAATQNMQRAINRIAWTAVTVGAAAATATIVIGSKKAIDAASDLNETISKSNTIFRDQADIMLVWSQDSATAMGMSQQAALETAATLGNMFDQLGAGSQVAAQNSQKMVQLAADLASFHNVAGGAEEVLNAMMSAFRGEYDALQRYVPTIKAATVQQEALAMTGKESAKELTELEKATAAMNIIINDAGVATGDFARTSDQLANQQRILKANIDNTMAAIGSGLTPVVTMLYNEINNWFKVNQGIVNQKMPELILYTADALAIAVIGVRAFHNGWLGVKLVASTTFAVFNTGLSIVFKGLRALLIPLDLIFKGMVKLGAIATNPFDEIEKALKNWRLASYDVTQDILNDIVDVNQGYEGIIQKIADLRASLAGYQPKTTTTGLTFTPSVTPTIVTQTAQVMDQVEETTVQTMEEIAEVTQDVFDNQMSDAITGWASSWSYTLNEMLWGADTTFKDILISFGKMLTQMMIEKQIIEPFIGWYGSKGGISGILASLFHNGGMVGGGGPTRMVNPLLFAGAPRLHDGLAPDEFPAILQRGERVLSKHEANTANNVQYVDLRGSRFEDADQRNQVMNQIALLAVKNHASQVVMDDANWDRPGSIRPFMIGM